MRKTLFLLLLAACCLLLTACYTELDPWPQADLSQPQFTAVPVQSTISPTSTAAPTAVPLPAETAAPSAQPTAAPTALPEDAVDVSPNFNG